MQSGVEMVVISSNSDRPLRVTPRLLDSISHVRTPYARKIVDSHRTAPLADAVAENHLVLWDDLAAVYLFAPELFTEERISDNMVRARLRDDSAELVEERITAILRGKPDLSLIHISEPTRLID